MNQNSLKNFTLFAAICGLLTVITTIGIHSSLFDLGKLDAEQRILLFQNPTYLLNRAWVIIHCLLVLVAMWGFLLIQFKQSPGFVGLGFAFFAVFSFTEIFRQLYALFYINSLRQQHVAATDDGIKEMLQASIDTGLLFGYPLFGMFILAFALGNLCYGISLVGGTKWNRILGYLLIIWSLHSLLNFFNEFWQIGRFSQFTEMFSLVYQPFVRLLIGIWLWQQYQLFKEKYEK